MVVKDLIFVKESSNKNKFEKFHTNLIIGLFCEGFLVLSRCHSFEIYNFLNNLLNKSTIY